MHIEKPAPVRKPLPLTPLVDVVFLLLMFFMLSSTFTKFGDMNLGGGQTATAGDEQPGSSRPGVIITVAGGPLVKINGIETRIENVAAVLDDYYGKGVRAGAVVLSPSAEVQDLVSVLERARASRIHAIALAK
jgi:biopolymer transport protein ExbD